MPDKPHDTYQDSTGKTDKATTQSSDASSNSSKSEEESADDIKNKEKDTCNG